MLLWGASETCSPRRLDLNEGASPVIYTGGVLGLYRVYIGMMEKKMETPMMGGRMGKKMETIVAGVVIRVQMGLAVARNINVSFTLIKPKGPDMQCSTTLPTAPTLNL